MWKNWKAMGQDIDLKEDHEKSERSMKPFYRRLVSYMHIFFMNIFMN